MFLSLLIFNGLEIYTVFLLLESHKIIKLLNPIKRFDQSAFRPYSLTMPEIIKKGRYRICIADEYKCDAMVDYLLSIDSHLASGRIITKGRNITVISAAPGRESEIDVVIKAFPSSSSVRHLLPGGGYTKARRNWEAAVRLYETIQGTPVPVAYVEHVIKLGTVASFYISVYADGFSSFKEELLNIYLRECEGDKLRSLLGSVAAGVRRMHDNGVVHHDLGNQNIFLRRKGDYDWADVLFIDLNRGRVYKEISLLRRASDLSRLALPPNLMKFFIFMYCGKDIEPTELAALEGLARFKYQVHHRSRSLRHPFREAKLAGTTDSWTLYPPVNAIMISERGKKIPLVEFK